MTDFRPQEMLRVLHSHGVRYVLIGGMAAAMRGSGLPTFDVDITPEANATNLSKLSAALTALDARVRVDGVPGGLPFAHDATSLRAMTTVNLVTRYGDLDLTFNPAGVGGFDEWNAGATDVVVLNVPIRVAALADIVRSKEVAGREKDRIQLPSLRALMDRLRRDGSE